MTANKTTPVAVVGIPSDNNSSFLKGAASAPTHIREAFRYPSSNLCTENGLDLAAHPGWEDVGDLELGKGSVVQPIEDAVTRIIEADRRILALGGDHAITYPVVCAVARRNPKLTILHLDAHPDLYDELDGDRFSHACPFARIMEDGLAARLIQIGIRTMTPHQREQAERFGVEVYGARRVPTVRNLNLTGPLYLSIDLDVLDPAHAPGISHPEPGGLATREVVNIIQDLGCPPVGADIVELNPDRDINGLTAMVAAKLLKEVLATMIG